MGDCTVGLHPFRKEVKMKKFWIIIPAVTSKPSSTQDSKRRRYSDLKEAREEAARRCSKYMIDYIILESMAICRPAAPPVEWENITEEGKIQ
jgi:hypothetical protein